jgi:hypothetical protein
MNQKVSEQVDSINLPLTLYAFTKFFYDRTKSHETFVNVRTLLKSHTLGSSFGSTFRAS